MKPAVLKEEPASIPEVKAELERIKERDKELTYRGTKTEDYLSSVCSIDAKKAKEIYSKIEALGVPRMRDAHIKKLVDIMPVTSNEVKVALQGYAITVKAELLKKIAETVKEFAPKK